MAEEQNDGGQERAGSGRGVKLMPTTQPVEEIYVDGALGMFTRAGVVKINLFRVVGTDASDDAEVRSVSHRLVMPVSAVPELVRLIQNMARSAREAQAAAKRAAQGNVAAGDSEQSPRRRGNTSGSTDPQNLI